MDWIDRNQMGRRNLTPDQFTLLLGRLYNRQKQRHGGDRKSKGQNGPLINTAERMASEYCVSQRTVKRAGGFAKEVEGTPELAEAVKEGKACGCRLIPTSTTATDHRNQPRELHDPWS